jgi:hypothetical protein
MKKLAIEPESCATCKCFQPNAADDYGYCRRRPPTLVATEAGLISVQPSTVAHEWCGDFIRKLQS